MERDISSFAIGFVPLGFKYVAGAFFVSLTDRFADGRSCYTAGRNRCGVTFSERPTGRFHPACFYSIGSLASN